MPTDTIKTDILFKKSVGRVATTTTKKFFEEKHKTYNIIYSSNVWAESDLIPLTAPKLTDNQKSGVVKYFKNREMKLIPGTENSFFLDELKDAIPFDFDKNGSYNYKILDSLNKTVVFGDHDWILDQAGGTLTFYDGVIDNIPPKISFYKYIGYKGVGGQSTSGGQSGSGTSLTVREVDNNPIGLDIEELIFNGSDETVVIIDKKAYINAPPPPVNFDKDLHSTNVHFYTGRVSQSNINYETYAGDKHNYIIKDPNFNLTLNTFSNASRGNLILAVNNVDIANIDLIENFKGENRNGSQQITDYNLQGTGSKITNGKVNFTGGIFEINSIHWTDPIGADNYQNGKANIRIIDQSGLRQGYNSFQIRHEYDGNISETNIFKVFYDSDQTSNPKILSSDLTLNTIVDKYISGIKYCDKGTTFKLNFEAENCFNNVYHESNRPIYISGNWLTDKSILYTNSNIQNVSTPPDIGNKLICNYELITVLSNKQETNANIQITPRNPYGNYSTLSTPNKNIIIMSLSKQSDKTTEKFVDEEYRFPLTTNFNIVPNAISGNFDSKISLLSDLRKNELQVYDIFDSTQNKLIWPRTNYSSTTPIGNPNYSTLENGVNKQFVRVFQASQDKSNGIFTFFGINDNDININLILEIKVPSKTDWMNVGLDYNLSSFEDNVKFVNVLWVKSKTISTGTWVIPTTSNGFKYKCIVGGTTNSSEPIWATSVNGITNDGDVVWNCYKIDNGEGCRINPTSHTPNKDSSIQFTLGSYAADTSVDRCIFVRITYTNSSVTRVIKNEFSIDW